MSRKRAVTKYGLTGIVTAFYGLAAYQALAKPDLTPEQLEKAPEWARKLITESRSRRGVVIAGGTLATLTWMIALL